MSAETRESTAKRLFIGGEWADAEGGRTFEDRDPFTGELVAEVAAGTRADARRAVEAAAAAAPAWAQTPPAVRQGIFLKAADVLESRQDEVVSLLARETGSHVRLRHVPDALRAGALPPDGRARLRAGRRGDPVRHRAPSRWACAGRSASSGRSRPGTRR